MLIENDKRIVTSKRRRASTYFVKDNPKGINIATFITRLTFCLFWRDIERCANRRTGERASSCIHDFDNSKIRENRFAHGISSGVVLIKQDISRFDITVNHPTLVSIVNCSTDRAKEIHYLGRG